MSIFYLPIGSVFGQNVQPSTGAKLFFFETGTSTPKTTFSDQAETIPHTDPVIADARGRFPAIFLSGVYDVELKDANDVLIWKVIELTGRIGIGGVTFKGGFDSSTNGGDYPASGDLGDLFIVTTGFTLNPTSGSHVLETGDFIIANKNGATGVDADWNILRGTNSASLADVAIQIWETGVSYLIDDYRKASDGNIYRAKTNHVSSAGNDPGINPTPSTDWNPFGQLLDVLTSTDVTRGLTAKQGNQLDFRTHLNPRVWSPTISYGVANQVNQAKQLFVSRTDVNVGNEPLSSPANWRPLLQTIGIDYENGADTVNDIKFLGGVFNFDDNSGQSQAGVLTKQMDATWALGDNVGGMAAGVVKVAGDTYHFFAISTFDQLTTDYAIDDDVTGANVKADAVILAAFGGVAPKVERIGSMRLITLTTTNRVFTQKDKTTIYVDSEVDITDNDPLTGQDLRTLSVPDGIPVLVISSYTLEKPMGPVTFGYIRSAAQQFSAAPTSTSYNITAQQSDAEVGSYSGPLLTNILGQIATQFSFSDVNLTLRGVTYGYIDITLRR